MQLQPWPEAMKKERLDLPEEGLFFMRVANQGTFDAHNIPVVYNSAPFSFLFFFLALLVHPEDPLRAEVAFQERKQD